MTVAPDLLEREAEVGHLRQMLVRAGQSSPETTLIEGPSGIGKSRLLDETERLARELGMEVLRARADEREREYPFGVVIRLLEARFATAAGGERERLFQGWARLAGPLLCGTDEDGPNAATADEFGLIRGLYWCVLNLCEQRPVVLLVDDLQWVDDQSLRFLGYLADRLTDSPVALVSALRSGDPHGASDLLTRLLDAGAGDSLRPTELSPDAVRQLLAQADVDAGESYLQACWQATGGNPYLVTELVGALRGGYAGDHLDDPAVVAEFAPHSVGRRVVIRIRQLGTDALALCRACAVLGDRASLSRVARLAGLDLTTAALLGERLIAAQILDSWDPPSFAHPMIRTAAYNELPAELRLRAHAEAAQVLSEDAATPEEIARHLLAGAPIAEPWAWRALHAAARAATHKGAPEAALRHLTLALELCPAKDVPGAMLVDLGLVEAATGKTTSLTRFERALDMLDEPTEHAWALHALGETLYRYGRHAEAAATFRRGADSLAEHPELALAFEGAFMCAATYSLPMHDEAMTRLARIAAPICRDGPANAAERTLLAIHAFDRALTTPPAAEAAELARMTLGEGALLAEATSQSMALNIAIFTLALCGETEHAQREADAVLADAGRRGDAMAFAEASLVRAFVLYERGRVAEAVLDARNAVDGIEHGWHAMGPIAHGILAQCLLERDELDAARAVLERAEQVLFGDDTKVSNAWFHLARGRYRLAVGQPGDALDDLLTAGSTLGTFGHQPALGSRALAGLAAHSAGDSRRAAMLIDEALSLGEKYALPVRIGQALRARSVLEPPQVALATLSTAVTVLEDTDAELELAKTLISLGRLQRHTGLPTASREPLRRAMDLAHRCGALASEQQARDELKAAGARPRKPATHGIAALTPTERRVADLAAGGNTNRRIAETLFLSKNTVDWHLRRVYRKLDVGSRDQLRRKLTDRRR